MAKISFDENRNNRTVDLMSQFFVYETKARELAKNGGNFIDVHEWQIQAANVIHDVDEEGLLHIAKEMYSWEKETINEYLEIYNEIQSGVRQ